MRARLKAMLGSWQEPSKRPRLRMGAIKTLLRTKEFTARRFRIEIIPGLDTYAVELIPHSKGRHPGLLAQHGYGGTPELVCGLTAEANIEDYSYRSLGLRAVRRGFHVIAIHHPSGYGAPNEVLGTIPNFEKYGPAYGKNRLHRMAIMQGRTLFGLDMMASSRGIDFLAQCADVDPRRIGMYGLSQGGQSALFLPALDERIQASVSSAYFNTRFLKLIGPHRGTCYLDSPEEDKFFSEVISCFTDSDIVSLIAPRAFAVEAGLKDRAVDFEKSKAEFARAQAHYKRLGIAERIEFIPHNKGHICATARAMDFLEDNLRERAVLQFEKTS
jgi:hypothetical protein